MRDLIDPTAECSRLSQLAEVLKRREPDVLQDVRRPMLVLDETTNEIEHSRFEADQRPERRRVPGLCPTCEQALLQWTQGFRRRHFAPDIATGCRTTPSSVTAAGEKVRRNSEIFRRRSAVGETKGEGRCESDSAAGRPMSVEPRSPGFAAKPILGKSFMAGWRTSCGGALTLVPSAGVDGGSSRHNEKPRKPGFRIRGGTHSRHQWRAYLVAPAPQSPVNRGCE